ncbi:G-type lectin S-receptor-like serine/threonine-protein kinase At4g03230 [Vitis riparia]|nr:G-type lectin S-receptor-like serine/threonine-protein kinase At4g03230 [Vitis riparia]
MRKCFCNENFKWDGSSLNCTQEYGNLAKTPKPANQKPLLSYLAIVVGIPIAVALVALVCIIGYMTYLCKKAITNRKGSSMQNLLFLSSENRTTPAVHLYDSERGAKHLIDSEQFREEDKKGIDVSFFHLEDILAATNNF